MMTCPEKLLLLWGKAAGIASVSLLSMIPLGCSPPFLATREVEQVTQLASSRVVVTNPTAASVCGNVPGPAPIQLTAFQGPDHSTPDEKKDRSGTKEEAKNGKKGEGEQKDRSEKSQPKQKITLPMAIAMCVNNNFRVLAETQRTGMAEADLLTASLIPNPSLFADCQLIPLQLANIQNQLGPPQWDTLVSFPIDWLLFGKRLAAMQAARLGVEIKSADFANVLRTQLARTVDAFYEVLMDEAYFKLSEKNLDELKEFEKLTQELAKARKLGAMELDRIKLAVHEAVLERHDRELALEIAKARLRPFIGRTAADPDYEVEGALKVTAVVPPPRLEEAVALAEAHRPDLLSGRKAIEQAVAVVDLERRRAKPQVAIQPGWTYQDQRHIDGFRNGSMFDIGIATTLPFTDRNQGNIRKAQAQVSERQYSYQGDRADALADVETSVRSYADAVEHLTEFNTPATLKAAYDLRKDMEAAYRAGTRKLIELLDAHKAYQTRLGRVIEFESFYWRQLNSLNAAVGLKAYDQERGATQPIGKEAEKEK
jgi:cobalt-zinc-cadmium efflux system outer membrane protein